MEKIEISKEEFHILKNKVTNASAFIGIICGIITIIALVAIISVYGNTIDLLEAEKQGMLISDLQIETLRHHMGAGLLVFFVSLTIAMYCIFYRIKKQTKLRNIIKDIEKERYEYRLETIEKIEKAAEAMCYYIDTAEGGHYKACWKCKVGEIIFIAKHKYEKRENVYNLMYSNKLYEVH